MKLKEIADELKKELENVASNLGNDLIENNNHFRALQEFSMIFIEHLSDKNISEHIKKQPDSLREKIEKNKHDLQREEEAIDTLESENIDLLKSEMQLLEKKKEHNQLLDRIIKLRNLSDNLAEVDRINISDLNMKAVVIDTRIQELIPVLEKLSTSLEMENNRTAYLLKDNALKIKKTVSNIESEVDKANVFLIEGLKTIDTNWEGVQKKYNLEIKNLERYTQKIESIRQDLQHSLDIHDTNYRIYNKHFKEDERIWGTLNEPTSSNQTIENQLEHVRLCLQKIDQELLIPIRQKEKVFNS